MLLGPLGLLLFDRGLEEMIAGLWRRGRQLLGFPALGDLAQVRVHLADHARLLPGLATGGLLGGRLVSLPAAFWEDPAASPDGLDQEYRFAVFGDGDDSRDESLALGAVAFEAGVRVSIFLASVVMWPLGTLDTVGGRSTNVGCLFRHGPPSSVPVPFAPLLN